MKLGKKAGFSMVETLVVVAIIGILMALYLPTLAKALRKAQEVAVKESARQHKIGKMADAANFANKSTDGPGRDEARAAFRQTLDLGKGTSMIASELLDVVVSDQEFQAYYTTLLDPSNTAPLVWNGGRLVASDGSNTYLLKPMEAFHGDSAVPQLWEFISTDLTETSSGTLGSTVMYTDGHVNYVRYPQEFPISPLVAQLSHEFMQNQ
ncbi:MAG TPA: type II secretion system protein [Candidatus Hydrogenedentes bacterium]|nr:type II secretion system protein [Candidatus Hydrogenedentota bacterium]